MREYFTRKLAKLMIRVLSNVNNQSVLRVYNHALLKEMQRLNSMDIEVTYEVILDGKTHQLITRSIIKEADNGYKAMNLKEAIIKKIDELLLKGVEVYAIPAHICGFKIGEISAFRSTASETPVIVMVLGSEMPMDAQDATAIYDYLESCYHERLEKEVSRKREAALKYLGVS